jgi:hypothetical protein
MSDTTVWIAFNKYFRAAVDAGAQRNLQPLVDLYLQAVQGETPSLAVLLAGAILAICGLIESRPSEHPDGLEVLSRTNFDISSEMVEHLVEVLRAEASGAPEEASKDAVNYLSALEARLGNENSL